MENPSPNTYDWTEWLKAREGCEVIIWFRPGVLGGLPAAKGTFRGLDATGLVRVYQPAERSQGVNAPAGELNFPLDFIAAIALLSELKTVSGVSLV